ARHRISAQRGRYMSGSETSIAQRLVWRLGALFFVALIGAGLLPFVFEHDEPSELAASVMQTNLERLASSVRFGSDGSFSIAPSADLDFPYRIYKSDGSLLIQSGDRRPVPIPDSIEIETGSARMASPIGPLTLEVTTLNLAPSVSWMAFAWEWLT